MCSSAEWDFASMFTFVIGSLPPVRVKQTEITAVGEASPAAATAPSSSITRFGGLLGFYFSILQEFPIPSYFGPFLCPSML